MNANDYFLEEKEPKYLPSVQAIVDQFLKPHLNRNVVLVTSGGTTVPLENQTVRFLDNFSAGTRGATSAEYFLENGYVCIFLHRLFSLQPYSRHYSHSKNCFLDYIQLNPVSNKLEVLDQYSPAMRTIVQKYQKVKAEQTLLTLDFVTVRDYLFMLRLITKLLAPFEERALFYLAAAVSDFFIPDRKMVEHKIQSEDGPLDLQLDKVPKILSPLVKEWSPKGFVVSFKLETDPDLLISKAKRSLVTYGHQIVIGNILTTRKKEVVFVFADGSEDWFRLTDDEVNENVEIESKIIPNLVSNHERYISKREIISLLKK